MIRSLPFVVEDPDDVKRFLLEAEAAAHLDHPNIVPIYEVGQHEGYHFFSMKLIEGNNLAEQIDELVTQPKRAVALMLVVSRAIHAAHQRGFLHRDIKPSNILVDYEDQPHITDFGIAKRIEEGATLTQSGQILGTPSYMSPEQARGENKTLTTAADVYSLGAILYELITGQPPFQSPAPMATLLKVTNCEPERPRSVQPNVDRDLETITLKCLEKDPTRRYGSAEALAEDLQRWLNKEPITARQMTPWGKVWRAAKQNPTLTGMSALLVFVLLLAATTGPYFAWSYRQMALNESDAATRARKQRNQAQANLQRAKQAEAAATDAKEAAEANATFLIGLFKEADPFGLGGRTFGVLRKTNPDALTILARGEAFLKNDASLRDRPLVRAALLDTIGNVYVNLGYIQKAEPLLLEALALRKKQLPAHHADLATSVHNLGFLRFSQGDWKNAKALLHRAYTMRQQLWGAEHDFTTLSLFHLALTHSFSRDHAQGLRLFNQFVAIRKKQFQAAKAHNRLKAFKALATAYLARALHRLYTKDYVAAMEDVTAFQKLTKQYPENEFGQLFNNFLDAKKHDIVWRRTNRPEALRKLVEAKYTTALKLVKKLLSKNHYLCAWMGESYASFLYAQKRYPEAEVLYRHTLQVLQSQFGKDHERLTSFHYQLARSIAYGRLAKKRSNRRRAISEADKTAWAPQWDEVEKHAHEALRLDTNSHGHSTTTSTKRRFYGFILEIRVPPKFKQAEAVYRRDHQFCLKHDGPMGRRTRERLESVLRVLNRQRNHRAVVNEVKKLRAQKRQYKWSKYQQERFLDSACRFAKARDTKKAMLLVEEAIRGGYTNFNHLRQRLGLRSLRRRRDFQELLKLKRK